MKNENSTTPWPANAVRWSAAAIAQKKIRTYNFKENRVTDHRIGLTIHQLNLVMDGALDQIIEGLTTHYQAEKLQEETVLV